jgi:hypothetical protein
MSAIDDDVGNSAVTNTQHIWLPYIISDSSWFGSGWPDKPSLWLLNWMFDCSPKIARNYFAKTVHSSTHYFDCHFLGLVTKYYLLRHQEHHWPPPCNEMLLNLVLTVSNPFLRTLTVRSIPIVNQEGFPYKFLWAFLLLGIFHFQFTQVRHLLCKD